MKGYQIQEIMYVFPYPPTNIKMKKILVDSYIYQDKHDAVFSMRDSMDEIASWYKSTGIDAGWINGEYMEYCLEDGNKNKLYSIKIHNVKIILTTTSEKRLYGDNT